MCERLVSDNEDLRRAIIDLKSKISLRDNRCDKLESQNEGLRKVITDLKSEISLSIIDVRSYGKR